MKNGKKHIELLLLGGTIATFINKDGGNDVVDLSAYIEKLLPAADDMVITLNSFRQLGGLQTTIADLVDITNELNRIIAEDAVEGIVVVMGTNVMEEAAFAINLLVQTDIPIIVTGAMRIPESCGADGPGNLISAICAAASPKTAGLGTLVILNDEIHSADYVQKRHPLNPGAFGSDFMVGYMAEGIPSIRVRPVRRRMPWLKVKTEPKDVLLYTSYLGDTGRILDEVLRLGYDGLVIEGTGGGSVPRWIFEKVDAVHERIPVVIATRIGRGDVMTSTYGMGYGTPKYREAHGYLNTGHLDSRKARILLTFLLMSECTGEQIRESFRMYSKYNCP